MTYKQHNKVANPSFYDILGVHPSASETEIKQAYRRLVLYWHPDKQIHDPHLAEQNLKVINEAYSNLKTHSQRRHYDQLLGLQNKIHRIHSPSRLSSGAWGKFWMWLTTLESKQR